MKMSPTISSVATSPITRQRRAALARGSGHATTARPQRGLSLVELMVALLISMLILIGLVEVFSASRITYSVDEGLARVQENGRFALDFLARDIRMAGNMGCIGRFPPDKWDKKITNYLQTKTGPFDFSRGGIEGYDAVGTTPGSTYTLPALYPANPVPNTNPTFAALLPASGAVAGSDVLVLRVIDASSASLTSPYDDQTQLYVAQPNNLQSGQVLIVADCDRALAFQATSVSTSGSTTVVAHGSPNDCSVWTGVSPCVKKTYKQGALIGSFSTAVYYVGAGTGTNGGPSLFRRTWPNGPSGLPVNSELVEGVENMQILYGVDSDQDAQVNGRGSWHNADRYLTADQISANPAITPNWSQVISARIGLLVSGTVSSTATGQTNAIRDTASYSVDGVTLSLPAADTRGRRVFTATVELRNRH